MGIKCKDGIVLGAEKLLVSKLLIEGTNRRIHNVDSHIGLVLYFFFKKLLIFYRFIQEKYQMEEIFYPELELNAQNIQKVMILR